MIHNIKREIEISVEPSEVAKGFNSLFTKEDFKEFCDNLAPYHWNFNSVSFKSFVEGDIRYNDSQRISKLMELFNIINDVKNKINCE